MYKDLTVYADHIGPADMAYAIEKAESMTSSPNQYQVLAVLVGRWVEIDPQGRARPPRKTRRTK